MSKIKKSLDFSITYYNITNNINMLEEKIISIPVTHDEQKVFETIENTNLAYKKAITEFTSNTNNIGCMIIYVKLINSENIMDI